MRDSIYTRLVSINGDILLVTGAKSCVYKMKSSFTVFPLSWKGQRTRYMQSVEIIACSSLLGPGFRRVIICFMENDPLLFK